MPLEPATYGLAVGDVVEYTNCQRLTPFYDEFMGCTGFVVSVSEKNSHCSVEWFQPVEYPAGKQVYTRRSSFENTRFQRIINGKT
jgi:hypothetical protein